MQKLNSILLIFTFILAFAGATQNSVIRAQTSINEKKNQSTQSQEKGSESQSGPETEEYPDPNLVPYRTRKSALVHLLSVPAKAWHLAWVPLGATIIYVEQNRIPQKAANFFLNDDFTAGFFPLISFGGNTGASAGIMVFDNNLFNKRKRIRASFLYSTSSNNNASLTYADSSLFGSSFYFDLSGSYFNDSDENFYISPATTAEQLNDSSIGANFSTEDDETSYATEEAGALMNLGYAIHEKIGLGIVSSFRHADIDSGDGIGGNRFPGNIPGGGATSLFSIGGALTFNFTNGWPRALSGSLLRVAYTYNTEINGSRFEFNRFTAELHQFLPIPFLAENRRLGFRGVFEKIDRIGDKQVPFYELSMLGDAADLRGFDQNRFRGRGKLFFNFEYRYPIWDTWDAVIFLDEGHVYDDLSDIALDEFHATIGTGIRFMSRTGFLMRFELAKSIEQWRALFQIVPNF